MCGRRAVRASERVAFCTPGREASPDATLPRPWVSGLQSSEQSIPVVEAALSVVLCYRPQAPGPADQRPSLLTPAGGCAPHPRPVLGACSWFLATFFILGSTSRPLSALPRWAGRGRASAVTRARPHTHTHPKHKPHVSPLACRIPHSHACPTPCTYDHCRGLVCMFGLWL